MHGSTPAPQVLARGSGQHLLVATGGPGAGSGARPR